MWGLRDEEDDVPPPPPDRLRSIIPQVDNLLRYRPNVSQKKQREGQRRRLLDSNG